MSRRRRYIAPIEKFIQSSIPIPRVHWETLQSTEEEESGACMRLRKKRFYVTSSDVMLKPHPHADAIIAFVLQVLGGCRILKKQAVEPVFAQNLEKLAGIWKNWWLLPNRPLPVRPDGNRWHQPKPAGKKKTGLFFTAGVDSFFTLIQNTEKIDVLIFVTGFDIKKDDSIRIAHAVQQVRTAGRAFGKEVWILRTNLRAHKPFYRIKWGRWHGAAMAMIGWLLWDKLDSLMISSSYPRSDNKQKALPWGSRWDTDKFWSASGLQFVHWGEKTERHLKVAAIADSPHVQRHLSVCHKNDGQTGNCGVCEKCVRTRLAFRLAGHKGDIEAFDGAPKLTETIGRIKKIEAQVLPLYQNYSLDQLPADLSDSLARLIERSKET